MQDFTFADDEPTPPPEAQTAPPSADVDTLEPFGLGWRWKWRTGKTWVQITFRGMRKGTSGPNAEVTVEVGFPSIGVKGTLTVERLSLGDGNGRVKLANRLAKRTGEGDTAPIDWRNAIDGVCSRILVAGQQGPTATVIGLSAETGVNWLIDGLVEAHQTTSIYGDGEVGKSWQALAACVSLRSGEEIIPGWRPVRRGVPLFLDWETDADTLNRRVRMICRGAGIPYTPISYVAMDGPLVDSLEWLLEKVADDGVDLVCIDSVEAAMAGSRSDGGDMNDTASKMNQVLRRLGKSAILVDHVNSQGAKGDGLAGKAYGSIFKRNWVRMSYELKRVHEGGDGEKHLGVYNTKRNNGSRFDAFGLAWTITDELASWQREEISEPTLAAALPVRRRMMIALEDDSPLSVTSLAELTGASLQNVRVEISRDKGKTFRRTKNDLIELAPNLRVVGNDGAPEAEELPWR